MGIDLAADLGVRLPSPLEVVEVEALTERGIRLVLKRDDLIHPDVPGNKWRKLSPNVEAALACGSRTLLTFGGAYSNHIRAVAAAGQLVGLRTIGVIRGEEHTPLNPTLDFAVKHGMRLVYMDRDTYRAKGSDEVIAPLRRKFGDFYLVPEGGSNSLAVRSCMAVPGEIQEPFDLICVPCGTGGTLAGVAAGLPDRAQALGFSALKGGDFLDEDVRDLQVQAFGRTTDNWRIETAYHFGGFAKRKPELVEFIDGFERDHGLRLEWVYVAKMMFGIIDMCRRGAIAPGSTVIAVITGPDA